MIFIDTGAFLAKYLRQDQYHKKAIPIWNYIRLQKLSCITSNFVLDETFTLLARRAGYGFSANRAANIYDSRIIKILRPDEKIEREALTFFSKYADQSISFTDCISFALMNKHNISQVFTFDKHFEWAGFEVLV